MWLLFWKVSFCCASFCVCIIICCLDAMKIEGSIEEMISNLFPNFDLYFEDVNANCDPEQVLNGNHRCHYEQFHFIHSLCERELKLSKTFARAQLSNWKNIRMNSGRDWNEQNYSGRRPKVKLAREGKWLSVKTTELESQGYILKKFEISMLKTISPAFLPVFFNLSFVLTECGRSTVDKTDVRYIQLPDVRATSLRPLIP